MTTHFADLGLTPQILANIAKMGYATPTPIQAEAIPVILQGRDVVGSAQTGTGKTAAFVLPILQRLGSHRPHTRALIVTPTRELAAQIEENVRKYSDGTGLTSTIVFGGVSYEPQISALRRGADIVVATPGRLLDHLQSGNIFLGKVEVLVLDEMDQMLDMGFLPDVKRIVAAVPNRQQTLLFSATAPPEIVSLLRQVTVDPVRIAIAATTTTASGITQRIVIVPREQRKQALVNFLAAWEHDQVLIFTRTKRGAEGLAHILQKTGHKVALIHGDRSQNQRTSALRSFKEGKVDLLVATSIAARGLDIPDVSHVVNFDLPTTPEEYVHRVGRTARASATGEAYTFVLPEQEKELREIERVTKQKIERVHPPTGTGVQIPPPTPTHQAPARRPTTYGAQPKRALSRGHHDAAPHTPGTATGQHHAPAHTAPRHEPRSAQAPAAPLPPGRPVDLPPHADGFGWQVFRPGSHAPQPPSAAREQTNGQSPRNRRRRRQRRGGNGNPPSAPRP